MKRTLVLAAILMASACGGGHANAPAHRDPPPVANRSNTEPQRPVQHVGWRDSLDISTRVDLPNLEGFWRGSVPPASTTGEPLMAIASDGQGRYASRVSGEEWKPRTDAALLDALRLFGEESYNLDDQVSLSQVVAGVDRDAPVTALLGIQEMLVQARIFRLYLLTRNGSSSVLLLDLDLSRAKPKDAILLTLTRTDDGFLARLGEQRFQGPRWADALAAAVGEMKAGPALLEIAAGGVQMRDVEDALNACAKLGMKQVRLR